MAEYSVDHEAVRKLGKQIKDLKGDLTPATGELNGINILPGVFPDADELKNTVNERKTGAVTFLNAIGTRLDTDGAKLEKTADLYKNREEDDTVQAKDVMPESSLPKK